MGKSFYYFLLVYILLGNFSKADNILIEMDASQSNHLKAYGICFKAIADKQKSYWLLNYKGGSFLISQNQNTIDNCLKSGVSYRIISDKESAELFDFIKSPSQNMDALELEKAPKIAIYSPPNLMPWHDAVTMALTYADIPYDIIYDREIEDGLLINYDWLHLHHEDFTGQYGKFYASFKNTAWYIRDKKDSETMAQSLGFGKVSDLKKDVAFKIREFVIKGGFLFAMCSAGETLDIALSSKDLDICEPMFDGDKSDSNYNSKLQYEMCFAFENFTLSTSPTEYEYSNIDTSAKRKIKRDEDYFTLFEFSAKWDPVPCILTQNHRSTIKGFMGQTTAFDKNFVKTAVTILGENRKINEVKYIHGTLGKGLWTFFGGHDPEDYQHRVGEDRSEVSNNPNSSGYRLILNNILFPSVRKKEQKT